MSNRSIIWRLKDVDGEPGPIQVASGVVPFALTGIEEGTDIQIDLGDGVWIDRKTLESSSALTATLSPNPPVSGEVLTITFSAAPDSVSATLNGAAVTLAGTDTTRTVTPATDGTLVITFSRTGYTSNPITVEVQPGEAEPGEPLAITTNPDSTFGASGINETDPFDLSITLPEIYAGTYTVDPSDVFGQPPHWVVDVSAPAEIIAGQPISAVSGFQISDATGGPVAVAVEWLDADDEPISGWDSLSISPEQTLARPSQTVTVVQTATSAYGSSETTQVVEIGAYALQADTFSAPDGTVIKNYVGESLIGWGQFTGSNPRAIIQDGVLQTSAGAGNTSFAWRLDDVGADHEVSGTLVMGTGNNRLGPGVRLTESPKSGYFVVIAAPGSAVGKIVEGSTISYISTGGGSGIEASKNRWAAEQEISYRLRIEGSTLSLWLDGDLMWTGTDTSITAGRPGVVAQGAASAVGTRLNTFTVEGL